MRRKSGATCRPATLEGGFHRFGRWLVFVLAVASGGSRGDSGDLTWRPFGPNAMRMASGSPLASSSAVPGTFVLAQGDDNNWLGRRVSLLASLDGGATWSERLELSTELDEIRDDIFAVAISGTYSYVIAGATLYRGSVGTSTWEAIADRSAWNAQPYLLGVEPRRGGSVGLAIANPVPSRGPAAWVEISDDAGQSWMEISAPVDPSGGAIDWSPPGSPTSYRSIHLFGAGVGVLYTFDADQQSWRPGPFFTVSVAASNGKAIAAAETRLLHSPDAGLTWQVAKVDGADFRAGVVAYAPSDPRIAYAVEQAANALSASCRIARSADGGLTWTRVGVVDCWPNRLTLAVGAGSGDSLVLLVHGGLMARGSKGARLYRSNNGGRDWQVVRRADGAPNGPLDGISFDARDQDAIWLHRGAPIEDRTVDAGVNWTSTAHAGDYETKVIGSSGSASGVVFALAPCIEPDSLAGAFELVGSVDGGLHWTAVSPSTCGWIWEARGLVDGGSAPELYLAAIGSPPNRYPLATVLFHSIDDGATWSVVSSTIPQAQFFARAPGNPIVLFIGTYSKEEGGLLRSSDGGRSWNPVHLGSDLGPVSALAIDSKDARVMYVAIDGVDVPRVLRSANAGVSWTPAAEGLPNARIASIVIDPLDSNRLYAAALDAGVYRSDDAGRSWAGISTGLADRRVRRLDFHRHDPHILYASTDTGPYVLNLTGADAGSREVIEFHHGGLDHYFVSGDAPEIAALDRGAVEGWSRTGESFRAADARGPSVLPVCRYFGVGFAPLSSHFYSPYRHECDLLATDPRWRYETDAFGLVLPEPPARRCPAGTRPLYRAWNANQGGAPNHRYTTSAVTLDVMIGRGWVFEGEADSRIFACVPQ